MYSSMEAYGMVVNEICGDSGIPYYYGPGTLTFVGCVLYSPVPPVASLDTSGCIA
jgi:hypothetical protein